MLATGTDSKRPDTISMRERDTQNLSGADILVELTTGWRQTLLMKFLFIYSLVFLFFHLNNHFLFLFSLTTLILQI